MMCTVPFLPFPSLFSLSPFLSLSPLFLPLFFKAFVPVSEKIAPRSRWFPHRGV